MLDKIFIDKCMTSKPKKRLEQVVDTIRLKHYSDRTGETYDYWFRKYIHYYKVKL